MVSSDPTVNNTVARSHAEADVFTVFRITARCTRALISAHFRTALEWDREGHCINRSQTVVDDDRHREANAFLGAGLVQLQQELKRLHISDQEWAIYESVWSRLHNGPRLEKTSTYIRINAQRASLDQYRPSRPSVFRILRGLLGTDVPHPLLTDWYRSDLRQQYCLSDTPAFLSFAQT